LACRHRKAKRDLVRLVYVADNRVEVDLSGRKNGRGAYLCRLLECWEAGLKGNHLEYTLKIKLSRENREQLIKFGIELLREKDSGENR